MATRKVINYEVNADNNRSFSSSRKSAVMSVAKAWRRQGACPQVYTIGEDSDGRVACGRIDIK